MFSQLNYYMKKSEPTYEELENKIKELEIKLEKRNKNQIDIFEHTKIVNRLKDTEKKSRIWLENSPVCTKIVDLDFNLQYMSESGIRELKIEDINEYYGKPYPLHFYPDSFKIPMTNNLHKANETGEVIEQEAFVVDTEGEKLWYHSTIVPVKDSDDQIEYIMVVSLEITKRKVAEIELIKAKEKAEESNQLKTEFINNMSHEIRTPMNGILGFSKYLSKPNLSDQKRNNCISIIQNSGYQLMRIVEGILEISELGTKQVRADEEEVCLNDLLLELFSIFSVKAKDNKTPLYLNKGLSDKKSMI